MKKLLWIILVIPFIPSSAFPQSNKIVFGPLEGDDAGVLTVHNGEDIEIEMWVRTDPSNPARIIGAAIALMSEEAIIAERYCAAFYPDFSQLWDTISCDGPFGHDPDDPFPVPEGYTCEWILALCLLFDCTGLDTNGEWVYAASFLMTCNTDVPTDETYYPFSGGWYPHSGQGTSWSFDAPPGGSIEPEQDFCGLYFEPETGMVENESPPERSSLAQNHPNPFNASTRIEYTLPEESQVTVEIYDILGRKIETLIQGKQASGHHRTIWNAQNQPSGIYFYRIEAGEHIQSRSCLLLK
jgi:hypothetical protein